MSDNAFPLSLVPFVCSPSCSCNRTLFILFENINDGIASGKIDTEMGRNVSEVECIMHQRKTNSELQGANMKIGHKIKLRLKFIC